MKTRIFLLLLGSFVFCATRVFAESHEIKTSETVVLEAHAQLIADGFNGPFLFTVFEPSEMLVFATEAPSATVRPSRYQIRSVPPDKMGQLRCITKIDAPKSHDLITHYFNSWPPSSFYDCSYYGFGLIPPLS